MNSPPLKAQNTITSDFLVKRKTPIFQVALKKISQTFVAFIYNLTGTEHL